MPLASTAHGALHYDLLDQVAPWQAGGDPILFHHGIGASAGLWADWRPALADRYRKLPALFAAIRQSIADGIAAANAMREVAPKT